MGKYLTLVKRDESIKIMQRNIVFLRQNLRDVRINTDMGTFVKKGKLLDMCKGLNNNFYVCHSYLIINLSRVMIMRDGEIHFDNNQSQTLGRNYYAKTKKVFDEYLKTLNYTKG